jgi:mannose-1-phosphate guanylyltransferase/mannose-1-phosphate guanylyltransferase/mannose-6-phosphate isomerase
MTNKTQAYALLLAGGSGTRLWPISREMFPKQLVRFIKNKSLIQHTAIRLSEAFEIQNLKIVCGKNHTNDIFKDLKEIKLYHDQLIVNEPCGRNTAPAILLGVLKIYNIDPNAIIFVFPADHVIDRLSKFYEKIHMADQLARNGHVVTFGITPEYPETGYGYIEASNEKIGHGYKINRFVEKPDLKTAEKYIQSGNFYWNAGMFAFKASVLIEAFENYMPSMLNSLKELIAKNLLDINHYKELKNISFDYAIMEKIDEGVVLPSDFKWSDIGSWKALYDYLPKDSQHNVIIDNSDNIHIQNTENCLAMGQDRFIFLNRLKNIALIDTPDALFVSDLENSRDAKEAVAFLKAHDRQEYHVHKFQSMEWGNITTLDAQPSYIVSKYVIHADAKIPAYQNILQLNQWHITSGHGLITIDDNELNMHAGENITIESGMVVSFENLSNEDLVFIDISTPLQSISIEKHESEEMFFDED